MKYPDLPSNVILEKVIVRLPLESLMQCKAVSKEWGNRLCEKDFIYKHLDFSQARFVGLDDKVRVINPVTGAVKSTVIPDSLEYKNGGSVCHLIHCDGLFLCQHNNRRTLGYNLGLWNPVLGQVHWITPIKNFGSIDRYGIGYHRDRREDYKVLRYLNLFGDISDEDEGQPNKYHEQHVEIFHTKSRSWTRFAATLDWRVEPSCLGVSVKGNMYWMARRMSEPGSGSSIFIQSFDFSEELSPPFVLFPRSFTTILVIHPKSGSCSESPEGSYIFSLQLGRKNE